MAERDNSVTRLIPPPLPAVASEWHRKVKTTRTLNDMVEEVQLRLLEDNDQREQFTLYLNAVWDEQAVEGSLGADNLMAAQMIREEAKERGPKELVKEKLATIVKALNVVLRRYENSRKERRHMIGGEIVPGDNGDAV